MTNQATQQMLSAGAAMLGFGHKKAETTHGAFTLPPLPYATSKNKPAIDGKPCSCITTSIMPPM